MWLLPVVLLAAKLPFTAVVDSTYAIKVIATGENNSVPVKILLVERAAPKRTVELTTIDDRRTPVFQVDRCDSTSIVMSMREPDYGEPLGSIKLFFNAREQMLVKRVDFRPSAATISVSPADTRAIGIDDELLRRLVNTTMPYPAENRELPFPLSDHPLPQSTPAQLARARPKRVGTGADSAAIVVEEKIGPVQTAEDRVWFGKMFYDGEGTSGVGGVGYYDTAKDKYVMVPVSRMTDWSATALLVEADTAWVGLARHPGGAPAPGGLVRHDLKTGRAQRYAIEDLIEVIVRAPSGLVLGTTNGIYVLSGGRMTRYRAEPNLDGKYVLISEVR